MKIVTWTPNYVSKDLRVICAPIDPSFGPFRYFLALIDAFTKLSHFPLLAGINLVFFLYYWYKLYNFRQSSLSSNSITSFRCAREFKSQGIRTCCESIGIQLEYSLAYVHETNGLAKFFITKLQLIAILLLMRPNLPTLD